MAANLKTIQIPAEVKLEIKNQAQTLGKLVKDMQDIFANADPGSSFGKSLQRGIVQAEKKLNSANGLLEKEFFSEADLAKTLKHMDGISDILSEIHVLSKGASTKALGFETQEFIDSTKALKDFKAQVQDIKKNTKIGAINGMIDKDSVKQMAALSKTTGFSMGKTFDENYTSLSKSLDTVSKDYLELQLEAQKAKEAMEAANLAAAKAKVDLNMAQGKLDSRKQANVNAAQAVAGISTGVGGASHRTKQNIIDDYKKLLDQQLVNGQWASGGEDFSRIIAGWLEVDEGDLTGTATQIVTNLKRSIEVAMKKGPISANVLSQNAQNILNGDASALQKDVAYKQTQNEVATATTTVRTTESAAKNALTTLQAANNNVSQTATLLNTIRTQMAELKQLQAEYNALVDKNSAGRMDQLRQTQADAEKRARSGVGAHGGNVKTAGNTVKAGYDLQGRVQQDRIMAEQQKRLEEEGKRESEQFINNLKQATRRWMGVQQIVNLVKRGMRQAYQDIKALDTAMTNIAVVTDMSVQDLWGKIDQYMSIAQQYGVTTQGVYEVSQLYYQQGLSTNEVMAATTETLKLARIAGMDYKDAADAMTVAIRSFKMEMSDAQRVTDVYSKVAAITASDSEELAVAMSKTASSAESVGSSFENTTAMLAVMVETTRESAQNLGSALKSIISRYGEMKAGKTTDEDGEAIYYNKVDQALASVGISLKDAQGQFRDFDDVIFELSKKWDSLDKNTQRYIATIMAGNRQQSRFIALVDNWERLDEVSQAAADSADAGLLQYAKTLDSLDTKLNSIKTSFQEFYMNIVNGPVIGGILEAINSLIQGFNKLGTFQGILNLVGIIRGLKVALKLVVNTFSNSFTSIIGSWKSVQTQLLTLAKTSGAQRGREEANAEIQAYNATIQQGRVAGYQNSQIGLSTGQTTDGIRRRSRVAERAKENAYSNMSWFDKRQYGMQTGKVEWKNNSWGGSKWGQGISVGGALIGGALQMVGSTAAQDNARAGSYLSHLGSIAYGASAGAMFGPYGAAIGGIIGGLTSLPAVLEAFDPANVLKEKLDKAEEVLKEAELKRATSKEELNSLESTINTLKKLQRARYDSEEAEQEYLNAVAQAAGKFPSLVSGYTSTGEAMIDVIGDVTRSETALIEARKDAAKAALQAAAAELNTTITEHEGTENKAEKAEDKIQLIVSNAYSNSTVPQGISFSGGGLTASVQTDGWSFRQEISDRVDPFFSRDFVFPFVSRNFGNVIGANASVINKDAKVAQKFFSTIREDANEAQEDEYINQILFSIFDLTDWKKQGKLALSTPEEQFAWYFDFLQNTSGQDLVDRTSSLDEKLRLDLDTAEAILTVLKSDLTTALQFVGAISYDQNYSDLSVEQLKAEAAAQSQKIRDQRANVAARYATDYATQQDPLYEGNWRKIPSLANIISQEAMAEAGISETSFILTGENAGDFTEDAKTKGQEQKFQDALNEYWAAFNDLNDKQIEELYALQQAASNQDISATEYEKQLRTILKGKDNLINLLLNDFLDSRFNSISRLFANVLQLDTNNSEFNLENKKLFDDIQDYDTWLKKEKKEDNETSRADYDEMVRTEIEARKQKALESGDYFAYALLEQATTNSDAILTLLNSETDLINKNPDTYMAEAAKNRIKKIKEWYSAIGERSLGQGIFANVEDEALQEFYNIINDGFDTYDDIYNLETWAEKNNVILGSLENLAFESYRIRLQGIVDNSQAQLNEIKGLGETNEKGFELSEANALLNKLKKDSPDLTWQKVFNVNEQGIITLLDFNATVDQLYSNSLKELNEQKSHLDAIIQTIGSSDSSTSAFTLAQVDDIFNNGKTSMDEAQTAGEKLVVAEQMASDLATVYNIALKPDEIASLAQAIINDEIDSHNAVVEYFKIIRKEVDLSATALRNQTINILGSSAFANWSKKFSSNKNANDLITSDLDYTKLEELWRTEAETYLSDGIIWTEEQLKALSEDQQQRLKEATGFTDINELVGTNKTFDYWNTSDWDIYYTLQTDALSEHGAALDNFGNIIVKDWEAWARYIATSQGFKEGDGKYEQILAEAKLQGKIALESYASSLEDGITEIATGLISDGEIEYSQLQGIIDTLQSRGVLEAEDYESLMNAYEGLKSGTEGSYTDFLNQITQLAKKAGLENFDTSEISAAIRDAYAELISSLANALKDGVAGTLSNEEYTSLAKRYKLSGDLRTSKGISLSTQSQQTMAVEMYRTAQASGSTLGVGEDIWAAFKDAEGSILGTYEDIVAEIERVSKGTDANTKEAQEYLKVLEHIKDAARLDPDYSIFAFMEQDWGGAGADTFDSFASSIDKVKSSLQGLKEGDYIDYKDFANMMKFLNDSGQWKTFAENTKFAGMSYEQFVRSVIENTDEFGKVNLEGIALQMGVGIDTAMEGMTSSMTEGLREVAQQQIDYLRGLEAFLKVMVAMEALGQLNIGIEFDVTGDGIEDITHLEDVAENWERLASQKDGSKKQIQYGIKIQTAIEGALKDEDVKKALEGAGFDPSTLTSFLFGSDNTITADDIPNIDLFGTIIKKITEQNLSEGQFEALALDFQSNMQEAFDEKGNLKLDYYDDFLTYLSGVDYSSIVETMNSQVQAAMAEKGLKELTVEGATVALGENGLTFSGDEAAFENVKAKLIEKIETELGMDIGDIELGVGGALKIIAPGTIEETTTLATDFQTLEEAAVAVETAFTSLQSILDNFAVSEAFREFVSLVSSLRGGGSTVIGGEGDGVADGMGLNLQLDFSDALNAIDSFKSTFDNLKTTIESTPIAIQATSPSTINVATPQNAATQTSTVNQVTNVTQTITVTYVEANEKPEVVTPQEIEYHWKATNSIVQPSAKTVRFNWVANNPLAQWHTASNPVPVYFKWQQTGTLPTRPGDTPVPNWTGTMNNISGAAYADGSIGRMYSGAELANKALVGELGPELAVYDGQYHMLGANGAEFVKLPSDAIVFNHKQTEGILKGQFNIRGQALAEGNVSGPAYAGGAAGALALVQDAISLWQGLLNDLQLGNLLGMTGGGGGGGGSGESIAAVTEELQEWYNLSRQIADIEGKINNLIAERQNLTGGDALKNLRQQQALLQKQAQTQKILLEYQRLQLERQKEHILNNSIWSKFLTFDESGNLQYIEGNETNGGKGALQVLDELNKMSGAEQIAYLQSIGYSYTDNDGKQLTGQDLVAKFFEELQSQISNYDGLYGIVQEAESALSDIENQIAEIEQTIIDNQIQLENTIYDTLVEAIEREIEELEEQKDLIEEANKNYINGLKNALSDEQKMYSSNENIGDRESLQRRLALLRRSGGSASEIYELEKQLDDMLKSEYFDKQQELIENISDANDEQVRRLEEQIKLQKESLEFQKEHGLLWAQVYDILSGSTEEILAFLQGNNSAFMESSLTQQQQMLLEWADQVGIYKEDQKYKQYKDFAEDNLWDTGVAVSKLNSSAQSDYNSLKQDQKDEIKDLFLASYANARLEGKEHAEALSIAMADMIANINKLKTQNNASNNTPPTTTPSNNGGGGSSGGGSDGGSSGGGSSGGSSGGSGGGSSKKVTITVKAADSEQGTPSPASATVSPGQSFTVSPNPRTGYAFDYITYNGTRKNSATITPTGNVSNIAIIVYYKPSSSLDQNTSPSSGSGTSGSSTGGNWGYTITSYGKKVEEKDFDKYDMDANPKTGYATRQEAQNAAALIVKKVPGGKYTTKAYLEGGLVDYTGAAIVHGSPAKPESFLNAKQTAMISEAVKSVGEGGALDGIKATLSALNSTIKSITNNNSNLTSSFTVAPGAITINVAELSDSYDVEELSKDIMNRMVTIASKATNRGVNRR